MKIKTNTKKGYTEIEKFPAVIDLSFPKSKTRRGRVQGGGMICPTINCSNELYVIIKKEKDD